MTERQQAILNEAIRLGDEFIEKARTENGKTHWKTLTTDLEQNTSWQVGDGLYSGVSGIALYLLELYKNTKEERFFAPVKQAAEWLISYAKENPTDYYAFITGRLGVSYFLIELYETTNEKRYLDEALIVAQNAIKGLDGERLIDDYINGTSGSLMALLQLAKHSKEEWLLETIDAYANRLINGAHLSEAGIYWDRSEKQKCGLCGFSHGVSGIAFALMELAQATGNETYRFFAEEAYKYEANHFNEEMGNWPDYRHGYYTDKDYEEHKTAYLEKDLSFFKGGNDMNAWCHGAMGIGLARTRAHELTGKDDYLSDLKTAIKKTVIRTDFEASVKMSFTQCHGMGGNADLFIDGYLHLKDDALLELAEQVAEGAIKSREHHGLYYSGFASANEEDTSLFMGTAGIGYFYLRTLFPNNVKPILKTTYDGDVILSDLPALSITKEKLLRRLVDKEYGRTMHVIDQISPEKASSVLSSLKTPNVLKSDIPKAISMVLKEVPDTNKMALEDIFNLENDTIEMDKAELSCSYTHIRDVVNFEIGQELLTDDDLESIPFQITEGVRFKETKWNWANFEENMNEEASEHSLMLRAGSAGVQEHYLSPFTATVLGSFEQAKSIQQVSEEIYGHFGEISDEQKTQINDAVLAQAKSAIGSGILVKA